MSYSGGDEKEESHGAFTLARFHLGSMNVLSKHNLPIYFDIFGLQVEIYY